MAKNSELSGFYKLSIEDRLKKIKEFADLTDEEVSILKNADNLSIDQADKMIENVYSTFSFPLGIATNFQINGKDYLIPMAIEEPSVVAAASHAAKIARVKGGFKTESTEPIMIGQIHLITENPKKSKEKILEKKKEIFELANKQDSTLVKFGGGVKDIEFKIFDSELLIHLLVDCRDAMGANAVNTICEAVAPFIEEITGGAVCLKILTNLSDKRMVTAKAVFDKDSLGGETVVDSILQVYDCAVKDSYRAATHNKGLMNGIDAVVIAAGNDFRAVEAGAHAYASISGKYSPLTHYKKNSDGDLVGTLEMPLAVGIVGGATKVHPIAQISLKILGVKSANELAEVIGAVGLAQNLAALRALAAEGIQSGHMKLHARNVAATAGAEGEVAEQIAEQMIKEKKISVARAEELLKNQ